MEEFEVKKEEDFRSWLKQLHAFKTQELIILQQEMQILEQKMKDNGVEWE